MKEKLLKQKIIQEINEGINQSNKDQAKIIFGKINKIIIKNK